MFFLSGKKLRFQAPIFVVKNIICMPHIIYYHYYCIFMLRSNKIYNNFNSKEWIIEVTKKLNFVRRPRTMYMILLIYRELRKDQNTLIAMRHEYAIYVLDVRSNLAESSGRVIEPSKDGNYVRARACDAKKERRTSSYRRIVEDHRVTWTL